METLAEMHCIPLRASDSEVMGKQLLELHRTVPDWHIMDGGGQRALQRIFHFGTFAEALAFTDKIGALAQLEGHHPSILTEWGHVRVRWWTDPLKGVHRNDFIMAAKTDVLYLQTQAGVIVH
jgi:4a-hydroxytetrahydrobiopterin dehydratase